MPDPIPAGPPRTPDERKVVAMVKWLLYFLFIALAWIVVSYLASLLALVLLSLAVAYLLSPTLDKLVARGVPRALGAGILLVGFLGGLIALIVIFAPRMADEIITFISDLPHMVDNLQRWLSGQGVDMPEDWRSYLSGDEFKKVLQEAAGPVQQLAQAALGGVLELLGFLAELLLALILAFYFLVDWHELVHRVQRIIPPRRRARVVAILDEVDGVVSGWVRGQALVTSILAVLYAIGFSIVGIHLAIPIGLVVGALTIIPFLGTFIGAAVTGLIVLLDWNGIGPVIGCGVVFILLHLLEAAVLTPKITGQKVGLGESAALFAVIAGGKLLGFVGVLLAVPLAATVAVLLRHAVRAYEHSEFFGQESDAIVAIPDAMKTILPSPETVAPHSTAAAAKLAGEEPGEGK